MSAIYTVNVVTQGPLPQQPFGAVFPVASEEEMLMLQNVRRGDKAFRTDQDTEYTFVGPDALLIDSWKRVLYAP